MIFDNKTLIKVGFIIKAYKLKGKLLISIFSNIEINFIKKDKPLFVLINELPVPFFIEDFDNKQYLILKLKGIDSEEEAKKIKASALLAFEDDIKIISQNSNFEDTEIINYKVFDEKFGCLGKISRINFIPGNPVIEIKNNDDKLIILPFVENFIKEINHKKQEIYVISPEGLIEIYLNN